MKKLHAYAPTMGLTIREAIDAHAADWKWSYSSVNALRYAIQEWEASSGNPKIRNITDEMIDDFETALTEAGQSDLRAVVVARAIRAIVRRVKGGKLYVEKQRPQAEPKIPTRLDGTLRSYFHVLYVRRKLRGKSDGHKNNFEVNIRHFGRMLGHVPKLADLTNDNIGDAMDWLVQRGRTNRTANKFRDVMLALWRFLCKEAILRKWPTVDALPEPKRSAIAWTKTELRRLWEACQSAKGIIGTAPASLWWLTLHAMAWDSAERITAIMSLLWSDIDLEGGFVHFRAETRKGKMADNDARLHPGTVELLRRMPRAEMSDPVFPWPYAYHTLWCRYRRLLKGAALPCDRAHKFHALRKSAASWFEAAGGNATELLQHTSRQVTRQYLDVRITGKQFAADVLFRPEVEGPPTQAGK